MDRHYHLSVSVTGLPVPERDAQVYVDRTAAIAGCATIAELALDAAMDFSDQTDGPLWSLLGIDGSYVLESSAHLPCTYFVIVACSYQARVCAGCGESTCITGVQDFCPICHLTFRPANVGR